MTIELNSQYYFTSFTDGNSNSSSYSLKAADVDTKSEPTVSQEPKTYEIQKGDSLWGIVKKQYGFTNRSEISNKIQEIAKDNDISNVNLIYAGKTLILSGLYEDEESADINESALKVDEFEKWNSPENAVKFLFGEEIEDFKMFDYEKGNSDDYFSKLNDFSQEYINKYEADGDKSLDKDEFIALGMSGMSFDKEYVEALGYEYNLETAEILENNQKAILSILYEGFLMNDKDGIQADEFASQFLMADYFDAPDGTSDGKINFNTYNSFAADPVIYDENGNLVISQNYLREVADRKALWEQVF